MRAIVMPGVSYAAAGSQPAPEAVTSGPPIVPVLMPSRAETVRSSGAYTTLHEKLHAYQTVIRVIASKYLKSGNAAMVYLHIVDQTVGWGRSTVYTTYDTLMEGDPYLRTAGLSGLMSQKTLRRCLDDIERAGLIRRATNPRGCYYRVVTTLIESEAEAMAMLPEPKQKRAKEPVAGVVKLTSRGDAGVVKLATPKLNSIPSDTSYPQTNNRGPSARGLEVSEEEEGKGKAPLVIRPRALREHLSDVVAGAVADSNLRRVARVAPSRPRPNTPGGYANAGNLEEVWRAALIAHHGMFSAPRFTIPEKRILKDLVLRAFPDSPADGAAFVEWAVENWAQVCTAQFAWMTKFPAPATPSLKFLSKRLDSFLEARNGDALAKWLAAPERTEIDRMTARGMTHEQAFLSLAERRVAGRLREENAKAVREAARLYSMAEQAAREARRDRMRAPSAPLAAPVPPAAASCRQAPLPGAPTGLLPTGEGSPLHPAPRLRILRDEEIERSPMQVTPMQPWTDEDDL